jgi:hypothetical protein
MKQKLIFILIIIFSSALILSACFFAVYKNFGKDSMISYIPADSEGYIELSPNNILLKNFSEKNFRGKIQFEKIWRFIDIFGGIDQNRFGEETEKIGLALKEENGVLKKIWLVKSKEKNIESILPPGVFAVKIDKNITAFGDNLQELLKMKEKTGSELKQKASSKFISQNFFNLYISNNLLLSYKKNFDTQNFSAQDLLYNLFLEEDFDNLFFSLRSDGEQVFLKAEIEGSSAYKKSGLLLSNYNLITGAPIGEFSLAIETGSFLETINEFGKKLREKLGDENLGKTEGNFLEKYSVNFNEWKDILNYPAVVLFDFNADDKIEKKENKNFIFSNGVSSIILNIKKDNLKSVAYEKMKDFFSTLCAFENPVLEIIELSDGSKINILKSDAQKIQWQLENEIEYLAYKNFSVSIYKKDGVIYLAKDIETAHKLLNEAKDNFYDKIKLCPFYGGEELLYFNGARLEKGIFSFIDQMFLSSSQNGNNKILKGCAIW